MVKGELFDAGGVMLPSVLLVEDQKLLRVSLKIALEAIDCCHICGEVGTGLEAVQEVVRLKPDVVLMDVGLPTIDGIEATWQIKHESPRTRVIMLTSRTDPPSVSAAFGAGADAYCTKDTPVEQIAAAISAVMEGETWLDPMIANAVVENQFCNNELDVGLSARESDILMLIRQELSRGDIAARLNTSDHSIALALQNLIAKLVEKEKSRLALEVTKDRVTLQDWLLALSPDIDDGNVFEEKYCVEKLIGTGGLGSVYKARHLYIDRLVAIKVLHAETAEDRSAMRNFQKEAKAIALLQHKNVVSLYDFGLSRVGQPYLVMEYVDGPDLSTILLSDSELEIERVLSILIQICDGLQEAHGKGIVHCDLKPSNVLLLNEPPNEKIKLADFGLVQMMPANQMSGLQITHKYNVCGTPNYMAPEQCIGKPADAKADVYALGCLIYELITRTPPFVGNTAMEVFAKHISEPVTNLDWRVISEVSQPLERLIKLMLSKQPQDRPALAAVRSILVAELNRRRNDSRILAGADS